MPEQKLRPFPFSAVVGHERLKLALILIATDPQIGGVLISGPRGSAKSTLARGLAEIGHYTLDHFVNLPLGATEEKVIGSIDLNNVLKNGAVAFSPGLLHRAHQGILYIDEVNLLPDHLVDVLLDVAACGVNVVERDGISHSHAAKFVMIGTMNPDEGELRPQLLDRFGFCVDHTEYYSLEQRAEITQRRLNFDDDPNGFIQQYQSRQAQLSRQIAMAQTLLKSVEVNQEHKNHIASICQQANVEGVRADITLLRAARAHAAWQGHNSVSQHDIEQVAEFALQHRRRPQNSGSNESQQFQQSATSTPPASPPKPQQESSTIQQESSTIQKESSTKQQESNQNNGDWGEMPPVVMQAGPTKTFSSLTEHKKKAK